MFGAPGHLTADTVRACGHAQLAQGMRARRRARDACIDLDGGRSDGNPVMTSPDYRLTAAHDAARATDADMSATGTKSAPSRQPLPA